MEKITFSDKYAERIDYAGAKKEIEKVAEILFSRKGEGGMFTGWLNLPENYDREELKKIKKTAEKIRAKANALTVIGVGGSYLGARSAIETLSLGIKNSKNNPKIYYAGINTSADYLANLLDELEEKEVFLNVISKSGTTLESALDFRILKKFLEEKYGKEEARRRIIATTDKEKGALKKIADEEGYETFVIPDDVGGRYSVFTPAGLLPIAVAGIDIDELMEGARRAMKDCNAPFEENDCYRYAVARRAFYRQNKKIELLVNYNPTLVYFSEWWKQLMGESEGKNGKGIFPASVNYTTDLHSLGQYIQEGERHIFETVLSVSEANRKIAVPENEKNYDGLDYLTGKDLEKINFSIQEAVCRAHSRGGVPNLVINIPKLNAYYLGQLYYFFEKACAVSAYALGVNPFNQPGVEDYKKEMNEILGKL